MRINLTVRELDEKVLKFMSGNSKKAQKISEQYGVSTWYIQGDRPPVQNLEEARNELETLKTLIYKALCKKSADFATYTVDEIFSTTRVILGDNGKGEVRLTFNPEAVHRPSLYPEEYPDGIENIALLITTGFEYTAKPPTGEWHGKITTGWQSRDPDDFLQKAIDEYNASAPAGCVASLDKKYKK